MWLFVFRTPAGIYLYMNFLAQSWLTNYISNSGRRNNYRSNDDDDQVKKKIFNPIPHVDPILIYPPYVVTENWLDFKTYIDNAWNERRAKFIDLIAPESFTFWVYMRNMYPLCTFMAGPGDSWRMFLKS